MSTTDDDKLYQEVLAAVTATDNERRAPLLAAMRANRGGAGAPPPTLFGLTLDQLEAARGYTQGHASLLAVQASLDEYDGMPTPMDMTSRRIQRMALDRFVAQYDSLRAALAIDGPYGDGARFAMMALAGVMDDVAKRVEEVRR